MKRINFDHEWKFSYSTGNDYLDRNGAAYRQTVDLPHDFMISTKRTPDSRAEGAGGFFQGGIGTYEKSFTLERSEHEKHYLLQIEGCYGQTEIWLNGNLAALHHYGYTEFIVDLTEWLKYGEENKLKIVSDNTHLPNSRWYSGAGLYRHVWLLEADAVYLDPWSAFITTPGPDVVHAEVTVTNAGHSLDGEVTFIVQDAEGVSVWEETIKTELQAGNTTAVFEQEIQGLRLWNLDDPYLYRAVIQVSAEGFLDIHEVRFGVRTIAFSREQGFLLNGHSMKLQGGCIHHDNGIVGSRAYDALEERKVRLLKESGYNAIRTSHNPASTSLLNACDRYGMLVLDEAFDCWRAKKTAGDYHLYYDQFWKEDLGSMLMRDRNHPSIIMYSIGNEIGERDGSGNGAELSRAMCEFVRSLDSTRPITNGVCMVAADPGEFGGIMANIFGSGGDVDQDALPDEVKELLAENEAIRQRWGEITADFMKDLDVAGYNYLDDRYEADGKAFPDRLIVGTESYPKSMKQVWERTMAHPYVLGDFTWTAFDYLGESGIGHALYDQKSDGLFCDYPWHVGNCGDFDICGFLLPQGKYRRMLWGKLEGPVITVLKPEHFGKKEAVSPWGWPDVRESYSWPGYEGKQIRLDIYSKAEEVEISVNGKRLGRVRVDDMWTAHMDIVYEPGIIEVTEYFSGIKGRTSSLETCGQPEKLCCEKIETDADDVEIYEIRMEDAEGRRVSWYQGKIQVQLSDNTQLIGLGTGNPVSEEEFCTDACSMYEGRALLVVKKTDGDPVRAILL